MFYSSLELFVTPADDVKTGIKIAGCQFHGRQMYWAGSIHGRNLRRPGEDARDLGFLQK